MQRDNIKIQSHVGTWYVIAETITAKHGKLYLLEHESFGDEAACLIVNKNLEVIKDNVWNGFLDLEN